MVRTGFVISFALVLALGCKQQPETSAPPSDTASNTATTSTGQQASMPQSCTQGSCPDSLCPQALPTSAPAVPQDACQKFEGNQDAVDTFSWNQFIALNWPADPATCAPNSNSIANVKSNDGTVVVWQTYMSSDRVFVASGSPAAWCSGNALNAGGVRALDDIAKAEHTFHALGGAFASIAEPTDVDQAAGGVLTDQQGRWLRYEKLMNQDEYNYITSKNIWKKSVLQQWATAGTPISLPNGVGDNTQYGNIGAIEVKAAWKVLSDAEVQGGRYFTTTATVYNDANGSPSPGKNPVTMGLVGLHIIHKTPTQAGMFWSTFEHVDNDKVFSNPSSPTTPNTQTAKPPYIELKPDGTPNNTPVQVKRTQQFPTEDADELNKYYQSLLAGSVFANYRLLSTQWGTGINPIGTPKYVANITMETFVQDLVNPKSQATGCFACHLNSVTAVPKQSGDHSFLFLAAQQ